MVESSGIRVCPSCEMRNKEVWGEYCVRCGESLQDVPIAGPDPAPAPEAVGPGAAWGAVLSGVVLLGLGGLFLLTADGPTTSAPPEALFTMATLPPSPPPVPETPQGDPARVAYEAGMGRLNRNDPAGASVFLARAVALASDTSAYWHAHALALWRSGSRVEGLEAFRRAVGLAPDNLRYRFDFGVVLAAHGETAEAVLELETLLGRYPDHVDALEALAGIEMGRGERARAAELYGHLANLRPRDPVLLQRLAVELETIGDRDQAAALYESILDRFPEGHLTRALLAETYLGRGEEDRAIELFRAGMTAFPDAALLHRGLASVLDRTGRVAAAITAYRAYLELAGGAGDHSNITARIEYLESRTAAGRISPAGREGAS